MPHRPLSSIFFGGGTPSLMPPKLVETLINAARDHWGFMDDIEITLEANPSSVEAACFTDLSKAGINRVSLGLQSFNGKTLENLGRAHSVDEGMAALKIAQQSFDRVSFDLIYAHPWQSETQWRQELDKALSFGTDHISLYQLTIETGTRFESDVRTGALTPVDDDRAADMFALTQEITGKAGLPAYEVSNHARPGQKSRHNLSYWRYDDYIGIGPGAHGRRLNSATQRHKKPENFLSAIDRNQNGLQQQEALSPQTQATEALMMGLRLADGIDLTALSQKTGLNRDAMVDHSAIERLNELGFVTLDDNQLTVTPDAMLLLDSLLPQIIR